MSPRSQQQNEAIREQTRKQVRESAFKLFAQKGFANTTISSIAKEAGISKGLIYHYFESKDDILQAIFESLTEISEKALDFPEGWSSREKFQYMLEMVLKYIEESTELTRLMISLALQPDAVAKLKPSIDKYNARQIEIMTPLLNDLGYENPENEAFYLAAKLDGITLGYITLGKAYPFEKMKQKLLYEYVH